MVGTVAHRLALPLSLSSVHAIDVPEVHSISDSCSGLGRACC